jgi:hypothetical protein
MCFKLMKFDLPIPTLIQKPINDPTIDYPITKLEFKVLNQKVNCKKIFDVIKKDSDFGMCRLESSQLIIFICYLVGF